MLSFLLIDENQARFMMKIEIFTLNIRHFFPNQYSEKSFVQRQDNIIY